MYMYICINIYTRGFISAGEHDHGARRPLRGKIYVVSVAKESRSHAHILRRLRRTIFFFFFFKYKFLASYFISPFIAPVNVIIHITYLHGYIGMCRYAMCAWLSRDRWKSFVSLHVLHDVVARWRNENALSLAILRRSISRGKFREPTTTHAPQRFLRWQVWKSAQNSKIHV